MYRMFLACLILSPVCIKYSKSLFQIKRKEWFAIMIAGIFLAAHFGFWFESLNHTTVASSTLILALQPAIALIGGIFFFKEKVEDRKSTRLNSSHVSISYAVFCLKKK